MNKLLCLPLDRITADNRLMPRARLDPLCMQRYREDLDESCTFPAVTVFHDGVDYFLVDGFHRFHAYKQAGRSAIETEVHSGGFKEAHLYAASANATHGLRRTYEDKRRCVLLALEDVEVKTTWSAAKVAKHCSVSVPLVQAIKKALQQAKAARQAEAEGNDEAEGQGEPSDLVAVGVPEDLLEEAAAQAEAEDEAVTRERGYRALRKADRFAVLLGLTLEELIDQWHQARADRTKTEKKAAPVAARSEPEADEPLDPWR